MWKRILALGLSISLIYPPAPSLAATIILKEGYKARVYSDGEMERKHFLTAGSEVEIPDQYIVNDPKTGAPNFELTLDRWLRNEAQMADLIPKGQRAGLYDYDGGKRDYFFPVKVTKAAPGSTAAVGGEYFLGLKNMALRNSGLIVTANASVIESLRPEQNTEAQTKQTQCSQCLDSDPFQKLKSDLEKTLKRLDQATLQKQSRVEKDRPIIAQVFKKHCGIDYNQFIREVRSRFGNDVLRAEIFINKINLESSGKCNIRNSEKDDSSSVGLFQINSVSAKHRRCSSEEKKALFGASMSQLKSSLRCLENPLVNLDEAIRIYEQKERAIFGSVGNYTDTQARVDRERMISKAYNGGERYVLDARKSLASFNERHGTNLNPDSWDDLKPFFFRQALSANQDAKYFRASDKIKRRNAILMVSNVAHAETLVPAFSERSLAATAIQRRDQ